VPDVAYLLTADQAQTVTVIIVIVLGLCFCVLGDG
jgi:hypothetical protein